LHCCQYIKLAHFASTAARGLGDEMESIQMTAVFVNRATFGVFSRCVCVWGGLRQTLGKLIADS